jgi:hypothetical protein
VAPVAAVGDTRYVDRRMEQPRHAPVDGASDRARPEPVLTALTGLCGRPDGPGLPHPGGVAVQVRRLAADVERHSARLGRTVVVDPVALLVARAELDGLRRRGPFNCGGSARLMRSADGWIVANLARTDDWDLVDAWLQPSSPVRRGRWDSVVHEVAGQAASHVVERAVLLGLPVAAVGERGTDPSATVGAPSDHVPASAVVGVRARHSHGGAPTPALSDLMVVDLSALWAGPLASALLERAGCRVVKVESSSRPDAARHGSQPFFAMLNGGKASVSLDLDTGLGRRRLAALVSRADVVVTAARPRALAPLGLDVDEWVGGAGTRVWLSITGYGTGGESGHRVAFGDDAAAAGGLVVWDDRGPCFCGDAIADPLSGLAGAAAVLEALRQGGGWAVDVAMADVAAGCAATPAARDRDAGAHREAPGNAAPWPGSPPRVHERGADTEVVLADLGIG